MYVENVEKYGIGNGVVFFIHRVLRILHVFFHRSVAG